MELSIICVNWNSVDYLRKAIASIYETTRDIPFEIIVVDNASPDGLAAELKSEYPQINLVESTTNLGFAKANNLGFRNSSGRYVLFLNPDAELPGPAIAVMMAHLGATPDAGVVGCRLLNSDLSIQISCIQTFPTILNQILDVEYLQRKWPDCHLWQLGPLFSDSKMPVKVEVISGACMMLKREVFENVGMFSEEYFMYADDVDLCYKVQRAGMSNYYLGNASVIHHGGKSSGQRCANQWSVMMKFNSIHKFCVKTRGRLYGFLYRVAMVTNSAFRLLAILILSCLRKMSSDGRSLRFSRTKWISVLKWSMGFGGYVLQQK